MRLQRITRDRQQLRPHIVVHLRQKRFERGSTGTAQHGNDLCLTSAPMRDDTVDDGNRIAHHSPMARRYRAQRVGLESFERFEIRAHVAVRRQDHGRHAFEHVITGEQQAQGSSR